MDAAPSKVDGKKVARKPVQRPEAAGCTAQQVGQPMEDALMASLKSALNVAGAGAVAAAGPVAQNPSQPGPPPNPPGAATETDMLKGAMMR